MVSPSPEDKKARAARGVDQAFACGYLSRFRFSHCAFRSVESVLYLLRIIEALVI